MAIGLNQNYAEAYYNRGVAYEHRGKDGDYERAKKDFETCLSLNPDENARKELEEHMAELEEKMRGAV